MKPVGLKTESYFDAETGSSEQQSFLIMQPDSDEGFFAALGFAGSTSSKMALVMVETKDANAFMRGKSKELRQAVVDKYVVRKEATDKYTFPTGALVGNLVVGAVLEVVPTKTLVSS